jgi:hypothetical protein
MGEVEWLFRLVATSYFGFPYGQGRAQLECELDATLRTNLRRDLL